MTNQTRTVALTPIAAEVASYVAWLCSEGHTVISVEVSPMHGVDTLVTFTRPFESYESNDTKESE